jgi:hypothetical protein
MLTFLERLASAFWTFCTRVGALILPFVGRARGLTQYGAGLLWTLRFILLAAAFVGLWLINKYVIPDSWIRPPIKELRDWWLPILGALAYLLVVIGLWLLRLLGPEAEEEEFADIAQAWNEAQRSLNQAGIDLTEAPLFLVLGRPKAGEAALFDGSQLQLTVRQVPPDPGAPLHVYANRESIFVTCAGASLLGRQAAILAEQPGSSATTTVDGVPLVPASTGGDDLFKTLTPQGRLKDVQLILARAREQGRNPDQLTEQEKQEIRALMAQENLEYAQQQSGKPRPLLLKNKEEVALLLARLRYLCRLIVRDRHPYCPVNGILTVLPFTATDTREDAEQTGSVLQQELAAIRGAVQVQCPVFALVSDLETASGFNTFLERFPAEQRQRRLGQRFPLLPDIPDGQGLAEVVDRSIQWISSALFPSHIYRLFRVEAAGGGDVARAVTGNAELYQLLGQIRERQKRLSSLITRGIAPDRDGPYLFGGCYLAATGAAAKGGQAFLPGVFRRLIENQSFVAWTDAGLKEEEDYRRWARYGYAGLSVAAVLVAGMAFFLWWKQSS